MKPLLNYKRFNKIILFSILSVSLAACSDEEQGRESILGYWEIEEIISLYGHFSQGGQGNNCLEEFTDVDNPGYFEFKNDMVVYEFIRNDTLYQDKAYWYLELKKERNGFFRENVFGLEVENLHQFSVEFGNNTRNSEKDANKMSWLVWPTENGKGVGIQFFLKKK
ncbi:MAG: hypothetical protein Tsb0034_08170 [Ekhidna sp.]